MDVFLFGFVRREGGEREGRERGERGEREGEREGETRRDKPACARHSVTVGDHVCNGRGCGTIGRRVRDNHIVASCKEIQIYKEV